MKYLSQLKLSQLKGKACLVRADLNAEEEKKDNFRLQAILPTLKFLIKNKARIVILSHRGRQPKLLSLKPFVKILLQLLKKPVRFINLTTSDIANISLLENLRFFPGEEKNDKKFAKKLASLGDIYINDAFAVSHRQNASVAAITKFLPSYAGLLLEKEIKNLDSVMKGFKKPLVIVLGGAKVSDKIGLINYFSKKADYFLIGGAMANTFFAAQDLPVGDSVFEKITVTMAKKLLKSSKIILPVDAKIENRKILDIGPETIKNYKKIIKKAKTIIWNGPMGYFENPKFASGTEEIARILLKNKKAKIIIGGGETTRLLKPKTYNLKPNIFISTGGGAMLEYLAGKKLPGIEALKN
jgi:phosphoglycerate kinase